MIRVTLRVESDTWPPGKITQTLGRSPDRTRTKGKVDGSYPRPAKFNAWYLDVPVHYVHPGNGDHGISASVVALGDDLAHHLGTLPRPACLVRLSIYQEVNAEDDTLSEGIHFTVEAVRWLATACADIDLDQYFYDTKDTQG